MVECVRLHTFRLIYQFSWNTLMKYYKTKDIAGVFCHLFAVYLY